MSSCVQEYKTTHGWLVHFEDSLGLTQEEKLHHTEALSTSVELLAQAIADAEGGYPYEVFDRYNVSWRYEKDPVSYGRITGKTGLYKPPDLVKIYWGGDCLHNRADLHEALHVFYSDREWDSDIDHSGELWDTALKEARCHAGRIFCNLDFWIWDGQECVMAAPIN